MAVLVLLVLALTRMFGEAANITKRGTTTLMRNSVGETAMDSILQDLDCMIVNERIACAKIAGEVLGGGEDDFDTFYFMTTAGDQDDDMPYNYNKLYVRPTTATNAQGAVYRRFDLIKSRVIMAVGASPTSGKPFYALRKEDQEWWGPDRFESISDNNQDQEVLAENVVMFDIYCQRWDTGKDFVTDGDDFYSSDSLAGVSNIPPVAVDVMLVLTSPEAAVEGGMLIATGDSALERRGWEILHRDASVLIGRAMPMMGPPQYRMQRRADYNPVSHYYPE